MTKYKVKPGWRHPLGATFTPTGTNFCILSRLATSMELLLYKGPESKKPFQVVILDPEENSTFFFWHVFLEDLPAGTCYTWRVDGPSNTADCGCRFDPEKELVDPRAKVVIDNMWDRREAVKPGASRGKTIRAMVVADDEYDWQGDTPLLHRPEETIIYELHVGG